LLCIAVLVIFVGLVFFLNSIGAFNYTNLGDSGDVLVAVLALVGGLFGALITLIGSFIQYSVDMANYRLAEMAEIRERNQAAVEAIQLFSSAASQSEPFHQQIGAIQSLINYERYDLAEYYLEKTVGKNEEPRVMASIIDRFIDSGNEKIIERATLIFEQNSEHFIWPEHTSYNVPTHISHWDGKFSKISKIRGVMGIVNLLVKLKIADLKLKDVIGLIAPLGLAWQMEQKEDLRKFIGATVVLVLNHFGEPQEPILHGEKTLDFKEIMKWAGANVNTSEFKDQNEKKYKEVEEWINKAVLVEEN
jgi:hypothetical protein